MRGTFLKGTMACSLVLAMLSTSAAGELFLDRVAPLLERRCMGCHNQQQRKGEFSLQTAEAAFADGFIERGDAAASHLVELISPTDGPPQMPKDGQPLSREEIALVRQWIDSGAPWPAGYSLDEPRVTNFDWWSYEPVRRPPVPAVDHPWARTPIDRFVFAKLFEKGLTPSPVADRRTLIRRLSFDLRGLPPTPEETQAFLDDQDPQAYEKLVDRFLASPHYGERWARHWLDVVKYADTCGYDKDKLRPHAWPYRDYVIRSLNEDKPYTRFVQEQIAGDVLFPGKADGILGLGFIAAGPWDFIGHVEVSEKKIDGKVARNLDRDDMVANTLNTFCSVTVQCARCHHHKFDPITQEHYYGLQAIFAAVDRAERPYDLDPAIERRRRELTADADQWQTQLEQVQQEIAKAAGSQLDELDKAIAKIKAQLNVEKGSAFGYHSAIAPDPTAEKWVEVDLGRDMEIAAIVLHASHDDFAGIGAGFGFPRGYRVEVAPAEDGWMLLHDHTDREAANPGLLPVTLPHGLTPIRRIRVTATQLAERQGDFIFALAELRALTKDGTNVARGARVSSLDSVEAPDRWGRQNLTDGEWPTFDDRKLAAQLADAIRQRDRLVARIETADRVQRRQTAKHKLRETKAALSALPQGKMVYAAATHFASQANFQPTAGKPRPIHVLHRGDVQQPRSPALPCLLPLDEQRDFYLDAELDEAQRRAALAYWLTESRHPLVWRSLVNRIWQYHFGEGLVSTPNDFGRMGALPTHPQLLDWLASEFRDGGQSWKRIHRLIVHSHVYRQSSQFRPTNAAIDGSNQFLWRMTRRRLEAEEIRDSILGVSGALNKAMGGPGYYLFVLEKTDHSPHYEYHKFDPTDPNSHRRSIYRFIVRSQPDPWMTTLDCADSSQSTPKRNETLTSLQALSLFNNRFNLVMAERFAERLQRESPQLHQQVERAVALSTQRAITQEEQTELTAYAERHGLANLCRVLFNLSEFVYLD